MTKLFHGYFGWMCYDCRCKFPNLWIGLKYTLFNRCCNDVAIIHEKNKA